MTKVKVNRFDDCGYGEKLIAYPKFMVVGNGVAEDNRAVFVVVDTELHARVDSKVLCTEIKIRSC